MTRLRKIIHVDMDAFYASVEQRDHPAYRGKPVVVGGSPEKRGAVAAASYEARKYGIHSAMPSRTAVQKCSNLIVVKPRFEVYRAVSQQIRAIFCDYTDLVEPLSLDEAYLDVTINKVNCTSAVAIAREIKQRIRADTQLTASAGVSINKFLAKVASDRHKPDGLCVILPDDAEHFIQLLPIETFHGIGTVTAAKMHRLGIHTGADLKQWSEDQLVHEFGKVGRFYYGIARARDEREVNPDRIRKSVGAEKTFETDLDDRHAMGVALDDIARQVADRLTQQHQSGQTLTLKIKYADYQQITRSRTFSDRLQSAPDLATIARELLVTHVGDRKKVRLLGISISNLHSRQTPHPPPLTYHQLSLTLSPLDAE